MTKIETIGALILGGAIAFASCQKGVDFFYDSGSYLQFTIADSTKPPLTLGDTTKSYSFYYESDLTVRDTLFYDVFAVGGSANVDRNFLLSQTNKQEAHSAKPDIHYLSFDAPEMQKAYVLKAGELKAKVPVIVLRDPDLKTDTKLLRFEIVASSDFKVGEPNKSWRKLEITDRLVIPMYWANNYSNFRTTWLGEYSLKKHEFMIQATGQRWDQDFLVLLLTDTSLLKYWIDTVKIALRKYNNEHTGAPLTDPLTGRAVTFP